VKRYRWALASGRALAMRAEGHRLAQAPFEHHRRKTSEASPGGAVIPAHYTVPYATRCAGAGVRYILRVVGQARRDCRSVFNERLLTAIHGMRLELSARARPGDARQATGLATSRGGNGSAGPPHRCGAGAPFPTSAALRTPGNNRPKPARP